MVLDSGRFDSLKSCTSIPGTETQIKALVVVKWRGFRRSSSYSSELLSGAVLLRSVIRRWRVRVGLLTLRESDFESSQFEHVMERKTHPMHSGLRLCSANVNKILVNLAESYENQVSRNPSYAPRLCGNGGEWQFSELPLSRVLCLCRSFGYWRAVSAAKSMGNAVVEVSI